MKSSGKSARAILVSCVGTKRYGRNISSTFRRECTYASDEVVPILMRHGQIRNQHIGL